VAHFVGPFQLQPFKWLPQRTLAANSYDLKGLTENAGRENDGPSKLQGMKLQDMKMTDQIAGHEIAKT